jgi:hypothetical protein
MIQLTIDAKHVLKKWSTWLAAAIASATTIVLGYDHLPASVQEWFPHVILTVATTVMVLGPVLIPIATSIQQRNIPSEPQA